MAKKNEIKEEEIKEEEIKVNVVAKGKSITCKRGIKSEGQEVCADDFVGGSGVLNAWIEKGFIV